MHSKFWMAFTVVGVVLLSGSLSNVRAQSASSSPASNVDTELVEVVVTARRTAERAQDVPQSVVGISSATLQMQTVQDFNDLQYVAPGLNLVGGYAGGLINPSIRGQYESVNAQGTQPGVSTYFADIYAPTQPAQLYDIADVQVLKGPQGTLFGRNSTGGAVLLNPERPNTMSLSGYVKGELGNLRYGDIQGAVNIPVIAGKLAVRLAGDHESRAGYTDNFYNGTTLDGNNFTGVRVSILFTPIESLENYTVYTESHYHTDPSNILYANLCGRLPTAPACYYNSPFISPQFGGFTFNDAYAQQAALGNRNQYSDNVSNYTQDNVLVGNTTSYEVGNFKLRNIFGYDFTRLQQQFDEDGTALPILGSLLYPGRSFLDQKQWSDEVQVLGNALDNKLKFIAGYYYFRNYLPTDKQGDGFVEFVGVNPLTPVYQSQNQSTLSNAVYAQSTFDFGAVSPNLEGLDLTGGYRYTWDKLNSSPQNFAYLQPANVPLCDIFPTLIPFNPATCRIFQQARFGDPSYNITLDYKLSSKVMVYVAHRLGYRTGGFNGYSPQPQYASFGPEHIKDYELGLKTEFTVNGITGRFNIDGYTGKYNDIQRAIPTFENGVAASYTLNAAGARIQGIELDTTIIPITGLQISVNYALTDAHYTSFNYSGVNLAGAPLGLTPRSQGSFTGLYKFQTIPDRYGGISVSATYYAQSNYTLSDLSQLIEKEGVAAGYSKIDARLEWADFYKTGVTVALWGKNLTDRNYVTGGTAAGTALGYDWVQWSVPRTYGISAMYKF